jgi:hypothetical protein
MRLSLAAISLSSPGALALALAVLSAVPGSAGVAVSPQPASPAAFGAPRRPPARPQVKVRQEPIPFYAPDRPEAGSVEAIAGLTSSLRFLPPPVAYLPAAPGVPSPAGVLGHLAGAPELARAADVHRYFRLLAAATDRVRVEAIGDSEEGREILLAMVSEAHNLAEIGYFRQSAARLADPRRATRAEAGRLAEAGKVCVYVVGGAQPGEVASPEMLAELAYRLAVSEQPAIKAVREQAIVLLTPVAQPDAYDRAVEWYRRHLRSRAGDTWDALREILAPPYAGHYGGAAWAALGDRGGALASTRAVAAAFFDFHPQVLLALGASPPLLSLGGWAAAAGSPPGASLAAAVAAALRSLGMPGIRGWRERADDGGAVPLPGGGAAAAAAVALAIDHNAVGGVIGVYGNGSPGAYERDVGELEAPASGPSQAGDTAIAREPVRRPVPGRPGGRARPAAGEEAVTGPAAGWPAGGRIRWSLRDSVNYAESATLEALAWTVAHGRDLLLGVWQRGESTWRRGRDEAPAAWIFPDRQADPARLAWLVRDLLRQRIEVHRLLDEVLLAGQRYPAGSYLVRLDQPYGQAALRYLAGESAAGRPGEDQDPAAGVSIAWPLLYGVEGRRVDARTVLAAPMEPVSAPVLPPGGVEGGEAPAAAGGGALDPGATALAGGGATAPVGGGAEAPGDEVFLLRDTGQTSLVAARLALGSYQVDAAESAFKAGGAAYPAGSWIVQAPRGRVQAVAERLGLSFTARPALPEVARHVIHLPRLAVLHGWAETEPSGWVRAALDREHLPYTLIGDEEVRRGGLGERFDVILMAGAGRDWQRQLRGIDSRWAPLAYTRTAELPSHGMPDGAEDITGGWGDAGRRALRTFVEGGGVLVTLGNATALAAGAGLAAGLTAVPQPATGFAGAGPPAGLIAGPQPAADAGQGLAGTPTADSPPALAAGAAPPAGPIAEQPTPLPTPLPAGAATSGVEPLTPAAELRARFVRPEHPLAYGYPEITQVLRRGGPLLDLAPAARGRAVLRFGAGPGAGTAAAGAGSEARSGAAEGSAASAAASAPGAPPAPAGAPSIEVEDLDAPKHALGASPAAPGAADGAAGGITGPGSPTDLRDASLPAPRPLEASDGRLVLGGRLNEPETLLAGRPAVVDLPIGRGHVVAFAFDPFDPADGPGDLRLIYNVLLNWHALPPR